MGIGAVMLSSGAPPLDPRGGSTNAAAGPEPGLDPAHVLVEFEQASCRSA